MRAHDGDGEHVHEMTLDARGRLSEQIWKLENVELTTVGIDIGSSTSHLIFAGVRLQRKTQALSSQFVVVDRKVLWKSPILLTPFAIDGTIDAARLGRFIADSYAQAGFARDAIDTGAVILTGEAIKRRNAHALADLFATDSGRFVCACAGHHLECALAAHGSGAVAMSRESGHTILNVDVGGGTTKLARVEAGRVVSTGAIAAGGRLIAFDTRGRLTRIDDSARLAAEAAGVAVAVGEKPDPAALEATVDALADAVIAMIRGEAPAPLGRALLLTEPLAAGAKPDRVMFSGGVSEYIYDRETRDFGDIARALAARLARACAEHRIAAPLGEPLEGIRATVIGAAQFTVQVSGKTIHVSGGAQLPLRNVPVVAPALELGDEIDAGAVAAAIHRALERAPHDDSAPLALAVRWRGEPHHRRLRALAEGIALALVPQAVCDSAGGSQPPSAPLVLMVDGDVGRTLGHILEHELRLARSLVSIDGIALREFDFVDVGEVIRPADVVPVVIKSLLFPGASPARPGAIHYQPLPASRRPAE
ncbi:MAG: ethanolamine ammonia-lyase reactivating factor EutA [Candidatus Eisenbacteria bacterium]